MGYNRAGYEVVGVDIAPMSNYPFEFHQGDAIEFLKDHWQEFDAIHASPPCQAYSTMSSCRPGLAAKYPALIEPVRDLLIDLETPWVIENVPGAPLRDPIMLCGTMFGYELYRHRLFESNMPLIGPPHLPHIKPASKAGHWEPGTIMSVSGHVAPIALAREIMGIDWKMTRDQLVEAIPPYYTEFIGSQLLVSECLTIAA